MISPVSRASAQGVTTSGLTGIVKDAQGAVVPGATVKAVHEPSGTTYEAVTQGDGRFFIPGMRVGGPYTVTADSPVSAPRRRTTSRWRSASSRTCHSPFNSPT